MSDYSVWAKTVNDMQILVDEMYRINLPEAKSVRTDGGLIFINCKENGFAFYGAYLEVNGYATIYDENDNAKEIQVSKGYMKSDGTMTWVYKNY